MMQDEEQKNKVTAQDLLDIIFEGRNKEYGAYELRQGYAGRLKKAVWWMLGILLFIGICILIFSLPDRLPVMPVAKVKKVDLSHYHSVPYQEPPKDHKVPVLVHHKKHDPIPLVNTKVVLPPRVVPDFELHLKAPNMHVDSMIKTIAPIKQEGADEEVVFKTEDKPIDLTAVAREKKDADLKHAFMKVQRVPVYFGGKQAWQDFLKKNIKMYLPLQKGALPGPYLATVSFFVHPDSTTSDFKIIRDPGFGFGQEALKIIQRSGKWVPGMKDNKIVTFVQTQDVLFRVTE